MHEIVGRERLTRSSGSALRADGVDVRLTRLHDGAAQLLTLALLQLDGLMSGPGADRIARLRQVRALVDEALRDTRRVLDDCPDGDTPPVSLGAALCRLGRRLSSFTGQALRLDCKTEVSRPPSAVTEEVLRAAQELLINACKHASGARIELSLAALGEGFQITVRDDGPGFDPDGMCRRRSVAGGYGLWALPDHLARVGARFRVYSRPGEGVLAHIRWPDDRPECN